MAVGVFIVLVMICFYLSLYLFKWIISKFLLLIGGERLQLQWVKLGAHLGCRNDQFTLSMAYIDGQIIPQNYSEGLKWLIFSAKNGHERAQEILDNISNERKDKE